MVIGWKSSELRGLDRGWSFRRGRASCTLSSCFFNPESPLLL
jgi:hypothetical protein